MQPGISPTALVTDTQCTSESARLTLCLARTEIIYETNTNMGMTLNTWPSEQSTFNLPHIKWVDTCGLMCLCVSRHRYKFTFT